MKRFIFALLSSILFTGGPAFAFVAESGMFSDLEYVADTEITAPNGEPLALCYQTRDFRILGYSLSSDIRGYVLAVDKCAGEA